MKKKYKLYKLKFFNKKVTKKSIFFSNTSNITLLPTNNTFKVSIIKYLFNRSLLFTLPYNINEKKINLYIELNYNSYYIDQLIFIFQLTYKIHLTVFLNLLIVSKYFSK